MTNKYEKNSMPHSKNRKFKLKQCRTLLTYQISNNSLPLTHLLGLSERNFHESKRTLTPFVIILTLFATIFKILKIA